MKKINKLLYTLKTHNISLLCSSVKQKYQLEQTNRQQVFKRSLIVHTNNVKVLVCSPQKNNPFFNVT